MRWIVVAGLLLGGCATAPKAVVLVPCPVGYTMQADNFTCRESAAKPWWQLSDATRKALDEFARNMPDLSNLPTPK